MKNFVVDYIKENAKTLVLFEDKNGIETNIKNAIGIYIEDISVHIENENNAVIFVKPISSNDFVKINLNIEK